MITFGMGALKRWVTSEQEKNTYRVFIMSFFNSKRASGPSWVRVALLAVIGILAGTQVHASAGSLPIESISSCKARTPWTPDPPKSVFINIGKGSIGHLHGKAYEIFAITLSKTSSSDIYVTVTTKAGTAKSGADYIGESVKIKFVPGEPVYYFYVPLIWAKGPAPADSFSLDLSDPINAQDGSNTTAVLPPIKPGSYGY